MKQQLQVSSPKYRCCCCRPASSGGTKEVEEPLFDVTIFFAPSLVDILSLLSFKVGQRLHFTATWLRVSDLSRDKRSRWQDLIAGEAAHSKATAKQKAGIDRSERGLHPSMAGAVLITVDPGSPIFNDSLRLGWSMGQMAKVQGSSTENMEGGVTGSGKIG